MVRALRRWWTSRPLPVRVALAVAAVALVSLLIAARISTVIAEWVIAEAVDDELRAAVTGTVARVEAGQAPAQPPAAAIAVRVLDRAGLPTDGGQPPALSAEEVNLLLAGEPVQSTAAGSGATPTRWLGQVATTPDGYQRLVVANSDLVGVPAVLQAYRMLLTLGAMLAAVLVGTAAWAVARAALAPVARIRRSAAGLPPGSRLPVPAARDEVRKLTEAINDVLARRDAAAERMRAFTGDAAHELRSPVAAIRAQSEVAVAYPDPDLVAETVADVAVEAERLTALLSDLLALARADAGERLPVEPVDLGEAARAAVDRARSNDDRGALTFRVVAPGPAVTNAARSDVDRVLDNLLSNACRHATGTIRIAVLPGPAAVRVLVDDDGPGVPAEHRERVFDRFHRVDTERDRASGGTGLGLALVAETVRRYGGSVRVGDAPGGGARLDVRWPVGGGR